MKILLLLLTKIQSLMKMKTISVVLLLSIVYFMIGCKKSSSSIVGTWSLSTSRDHIYSGGMSIHDTTYNQPTGISLSFTSDGHSTSYSRLGNDTGTYQLSSNNLTIINNAFAGKYILTSLNDHTLGIQYNDTSGYPTLIYNQVTYTFSH
jgi:hypothetical protein